MMKLPVTRISSKIWAANDTGAGKRWHSQIGGCLLNKSQRPMPLTQGVSLTTSRQATVFLHLALVADACRPVVKRTNIVLLDRFRSIRP